MTQEQTFLALLDDHEPAVRRIARVYAGPDGEEDDLYQEILMQLWRSLPSFRGDSSVGTWLYRVALNSALTWKRKRKRYEASTSQRISAQHEDRVTGQQSVRSQAAILRDFLGGLREPDRSILLLYMEGLAYQDIAEVVGICRSAVGVRIHRIKLTFTEQFVER